MTARISKLLPWSTLLLQSTQPVLTTSLHSQRHSHTSCTPCIPWSSLHLSAFLTLSRQTLLSPLLTSITSLSLSFPTRLPKATHAQLCLQQARMWVLISSSVSHSSRQLEASLISAMGSLNPNLTILNLGASPSNELYFQSPRLQLQKFLSIEKIIPLSLPTWPQSKQSLWLIFSC